MSISIITTKTNKPLMKQSQNQNTLVSKKQLMMNYKYKNKKVKKRKKQILKQNKMMKTQPTKS